MTATLFASWKEFAETAGEPPGTSRALGDRLEGAGFRRIRNELGLRGRGFVGIRLKMP